MVCFFLDSNVQYRRSKSFFFTSTFVYHYSISIKLQACILWSIFLKIYLCHFFIPFRQSAEIHLVGVSSPVKNSNTALVLSTVELTELLPSLLISRQFNKLWCIFFFIYFKKSFHCFLEVFWCYFFGILNSSPNF
jgi:hypothetical protein